MVFAHELYHDYFPAVELETREQLKAGLGVQFALSHFSEAHWSECLRLFAGLTNCTRILVERGSENNPFLAWQLLRDANDQTPELLEMIWDEAYCALSAELKSEAQARMAGACIFVLADLNRANLLKQAITEQRDIFQSRISSERSDQERRAALERRMEVALPLSSGLLLLLRLGLMEQRSGQVGSSRSTFGDSRIGAD